MIISQNGAVDLIPEYNRALRPIFCVSEGDANSRTINLTVTSAGEVFTIPEGAEVYVAGKKQDNTIFTYQCAYSGYIVSFPIAEQMSAANGLVLCELQIVVAGDPLGSANFCYWVEPSPIANGSSSESDLNIFEQAIAALGGYEYLTSEVSVLSARMDQFARLPDGSLSTAADAELVDIRVKTDGSTASTAGDAVREQITELKDDFNDYVYGTSKSFAVTGNKVNKFKMLLLKGQTYTVTNNTGVKVNVILFKADGTQNVITSNLVNGASISFVVNSDDYVQIGGFINADPTGTFDVAGGVDSLEILNSVEALNETVGTITEIKGFDAQVTDYEEHPDEFFANGSATASSAWVWYKFPVAVGDSFSIHTAAGYSARAWFLLDSNNQVFSFDQYNGATKVDTWDYTVTNLRAAYLIVNCNTTMTAVSIVKHITNFTAVDNNRIIIEGKDIEDTIDELRDSIPSESVGNILFGKTLVCCGDSITYGADMTGDELVTPAIESYQYSAYTKKWTKWTANEPAAYGYQIAARNNMVFYNGGVSGACVQGSGGTSTVPGFSVADGEYTLLPDNIDYLTLFFGWNDTATGSLGTINDTTNDSYYGGYNVVLPYLINKYPYTKIALIVPFGTDVGHRQAIRDLANKWGLACFDMYKEGTPLYWGKEPDVDVDASIVTANREKFWAQTNSPHPNIHGHFQIGTMLEAFLRGI